MDNDNLSAEFTRPNLAGNPHDDDGRVFDSLFEANPDPTMKEVAAALPYEKPAHIDEPKRGTRLITGTMAINGDQSAPMLLLPADPKRKHVVISLSQRTPGNRGHVYFAGSADALSGLTVSVYDPQDAQTVYQYPNAMGYLDNYAASEIRFDDYTGPLYVRTVHNPAQPDPAVWFIGYAAVTE